MHSPLRSMSALFCLVLYWLSPALAEIIQYCHDDPVFCFSVTLQQNETSGHDVYLTITATPSDLGGWTSIGFGTGMKDALMFIIYADQDQESLVTSIRTADGHVMPTVFQGHTHDIEVLHADASESNYYAQFVCHSCDVWSPAKIDANGNTSFIYAGTSKQAFHGADLNSKLTVHEYSGVVTGDLSSAWKLHKDDRIPEIKPNEIIGFNEPSKPSQDESVFSRVRVHGFIMTVAFMGLFFAGSLAIRLPLLRAFKYHWVIQLSASLLALGSAAYMVLRSTHFGTHKIIGIIVVSSLVVQAAAGYKHHIDFVKIRRRGLFSLVHRWLGRSIFVLGTLNVGLGMYYRGWSTMGMLGWFVIWSAELVSYAYVQLQHRRRTMKEQRGQPVALRDSDSEVFDIGDDLEDDDDIEGIPLMETDKHGAK